VPHPHGAAARAQALGARGAQRLHLHLLLRLPRVLGVHGEMMGAQLCQVRAPRALAAAARQGGAAPNNSRTGGRCNRSV
jgi:hypothetical protein